MTCDHCGEELEIHRENYRYAESGLERVTLEDIEIRVCPRCGAREAVIPRVAELHRVLARLVAEKAARLSGAEFRFLRKHMGYGSAEFADVLGVAPETISRWENEKQAIPQVTEIAIRELVRSGRRADEYRPPSGEPATTPFFIGLDKSWHPKQAA